MPLAPLPPVPPFPPGTQPHEIPAPPGAPPHDVVIQVYRALIQRQFELCFEGWDRELDHFYESDEFEQIALRAKWTKINQILSAAYRSIEKYDSEFGKAELVGQIFGFQLGLPGYSLPCDVEKRISWFKERIARGYETELRAEINLYSVRSPVEAVFLAEWRYLHVDDRYRLTLLPHQEVEVDGHKYTIDFAIHGKGVRIAIEVDGHLFHEKTKVQATKDRRRERAIQKVGYFVVRFTGSEVISNSRKCVQEVLEIVARIRGGVR
jgi:hypothetical protein